MRAPAMDGTYAACTACTVSTAACTVTATVSAMARTSGAASATTGPSVIPGGQRAPGGPAASPGAVTHDHPGPGRNRRAVHELHKALAEVARTGDEQLRGEAAQIVTEATSRLNALLPADRGRRA